MKKLQMIKQVLEDAGGGRQPKSKSSQEKQSFFSKGGGSEEKIGGDTAQFLHRKDDHSNSSFTLGK